ncbi:MAG: hypothetical protein KDK99_07010 [Verrucomicrobiales bacterium]|nr:hypothetical protein [Verrucomicrobiales bacterium]
MNGPIVPIPTPYPKAWELPEAIRSRFGRDAGRQRAIFEQGHLLLVLHHLPGPDDLDRKPAFFWRKPDGEWRSTEGKGQSARTLEAFLRTMTDRLAEMEAQEIAAKTASQYHTLLEHLGPIVRTLRGQHRALQQARELSGNDPDVISARDTAAQQERNAELLLQDSQFGLQFTTARQAEEQAQAAQRMAATAHRLNLLAALFLPLTAITGLFGMEVHSGLANSPRNFYLILFWGLLSGILLGLLINRRPRSS